MICVIIELGSPAKAFEKAEPQEAATRPESPYKFLEMTKANI